MNETDNIEANKADNLKPLARRRGPPKGIPRPPGAGRKKGTPNRATRDVREAAQKHTVKALRTLVKLLSDPDSRVQATAARELLDRAHGKPMSPTELTGKDGGPLTNAPANLSDNLDLARLITFQIRRGEQAAHDIYQSGAAGPNVVPFPDEAKTHPPVAPVEVPSIDPAPADVEDHAARNLREDTERRQMQSRPEQRTYTPSRSTRAITSRPR